MSKIVQEGEFTRADLVWMQFKSSGTPERFYLQENGELVYDPRDEYFRKGYHVYTLEKLISFDYKRIPIEDNGEPNDNSK